MKYFIFTCSLFFSLFLVNAQQKQPQNNEPGPAAINKDTVPTYIHTWQITDDQLLKAPALLDTSLKNIHIYNPVFHHTISTAYLGNIGLAAQSNLFFDRHNKHQFIFLNPYRNYIFNPQNTIYFNTNKPYTQLEYAMSNQQIDEQTLSFLHTQNVNPGFNVGLRYQLFASPGQYDYQQTANSSYGIFGSFEGKQYSIFSNLNLNAIKITHNGGIMLDSIDAENEFFPTFLENAQEKQNLFSAAITQRFAFGPTDTITKNDTIHFEIIEPKVSIAHKFQYERYYRWYSDENVNSPLYQPYTKHNQSLTFDSVFYSSIYNRFQIDLNQNPRSFFKVQSQFYIDNKLTYIHNTSDTIFNIDNNYSNSAIGVHLFTNENRNWNWHGSAKYFLLGYKSGDLVSDLAFRTQLNFKKDTFRLNLQGKYAYETPLFFLSNYSSNYFIWEQNYNKTETIHLGTHISSQKYKLKLGTDLANIRKYIYFNSLANPTQANKPLQVISIYLNKNIDLGHFHFINALVYQKSSDQKILPLPEFSLYTSAYIEHSLFKNALHIQTGFDLRYNTKFYIPAYMPATGQFYNQTSLKAGNYPAIDFFFDFKIKAVRLYMKLEHINSLWNSQMYTTTYQYPIDPMTLKFGLLWPFHN